MGKVLLELQPNKRDLLPAHKLAPHDVVILNKAELVKCSTRARSGISVKGLFNYCSI